MLASMANWLTPTSLFLLLNIMIGTIFLIFRFSPSKGPHRQHFEHHEGGGYSSAPPLLHRAPSLIDRVKSMNFSNYKFPLPSYTDIDHHLQAENSAAHSFERTPSILDRVKSINFSRYKSSLQNPDTEYIQPTERGLSRAPSLLERVKSIDFTSFYRSDSFKSNSEKEPRASEELELGSDTNMSPLHDEMKRSKSESKVKQRKLQEKMTKSASDNSGLEKEEEDGEGTEKELERRRPATTRIEKTSSFGDDDQGVDAKADDFINKFKQQLKLQRLDSLLRYRDMLKGK